MFLIGLCIGLFIFIVPNVYINYYEASYNIKYVLFYSIGMIVISVADIGISLPDPTKTEYDIEEIYEFRKKIEHNELKTIKYIGYIMCIISILLIIC